MGANPRPGKRIRPGGSITKANQHYPLFGVSSPGITAREIT